MRRGFGIIGVVVTLTVIAVVGAIAYQIGYSDGFAQHVPEGTTAVAPYPYYYGGFGFFHFGWIFGLLFFLFLTFVFFRIVAFGVLGGRRRGWGMYGGGRGWGMSGGGIPPAIDERMSEWHRQAHGEPPATPAPPPPPPPSGQVAS